MPLLLLINKLPQRSKNLVLLWAAKYRQKVKSYILLKAEANI